VTVAVAWWANAAAIASPAPGPGPPAGAAPDTPTAISSDALRAAAAAETVSGKAVLYRDRWGVPHVYAAREEDGYFGLGYAQAEDQLERLLELVRMSRGERASVDGASALASDTFQRLWRHREEAEAGWSRLEPQAQANHRSFTAGIERFMAEHPERVPAAAIELDPIDFVLLPRALFFLAYHAVEGLADCLKGGVEIDPLLALPGSGAGARSGVGAGLEGAQSNGWAVMPRRTADRGTIVLSDPHVEIGLPIYWEYRVHAGTLHSSGFMMGALLWQAHTRDLSWAMTTGSPDIADCYAIEVDPSHPRRYRFDGEWREMEVETTTIEVAGESPVERVFEYTRHGGVLSPVIAREGDRAWVVSVAAMHDAGLLDQEIHRLNHAPDLAAARSAMELLGMFPQTVIVGDRHGSVLYVRAGKSPRRPAGFDWSKPVEGSTSASAWQGFHVLADHIQIADPEAGYVFDTNNAPDVAVSGAGAHPDYLFHDQPGRITWRGHHAAAVLGGDADFTWDEAVALALDETWPATRRWQEAIAYARTTASTSLAKDPALDAFIARLLRFDGRANAGSSDALAFLIFREGLFSAFEQAGIELDDGPTWQEGDLDAELARVLSAHASRARAAWESAGGEQAVLGDRFRIGRNGGWGIGGVTIDEPAILDCRARLSPYCDVTMRALRADQADASGQRRVARGSQALRLVQFTDPIRSFTLHPWGQSHDPESPHHDDQSALAGEPRLKPTWFERGELMQHLESARVLEASGPVEATDAETGRDHPSAAAP
jgi:acyl-homoserine lactone acylase PvdQ